ncbi:ankyrin repeat and protein kinase domain-containing protein 1-like isoform X1 [Periplaneta americana]|uniref:ankyrin repeat and protein kinase domain-containing protein 1-like isoform X1 n=2 Tax=Periplaneta americana TaxID=6978 RepID=UPI0037E896C5
MDPTRGHSMTSPRSVSDAVQRPSRMRLVDAELYNAARERNLQGVQKCLAGGGDVNCRRLDGVTPLHMAAESGDQRLLNVLLAAETLNPDLRTSQGHSALYSAVETGHEGVVVALLRRGARPDAADALGRTPLHVAVSLNRPRLVKLLLDAGASPNLEDDFGESPLDFAVLRRESLPLTRLLLTRGGVPGPMLLHKAVLQGCVDLAYELLRNGRADVNGRAELQQYTPLHYAVLAGNRDAASVLLKAGADPHVKGYNGVSPLKMATMYRDLKMQEMLSARVVRQ